jgi:hypothetical protein
MDEKSGHFTQIVGTSISRGRVGRYIEPPPTPQLW